ncbi:MAG: lysylphosphatidylglycerol synthase domain-containing protein [Roseococcus sp.]
MWSPAGLARRFWPVLICSVACSWALFVFDWRMVGAALLRFDITLFLSICVPLGVLLFSVRSLRWAAVAGMRFDAPTLWRTHVQTALALATAAATPLQAGEALKLKFARDTTGQDYASLGGAFALERLTDAAVLLGMGAIGFGLAGASGMWLLTASLLLALAVGFAPLALRRLAGARLSPHLSSALAPLAQYRPALWRMLVLGTCTVTKWVIVVLMWQTTFLAAGITLGAPETALVVVLVTISVTVSLVPGGIGVAEVSTRALLLWLGVEPSLADAGAVLLRLLTPLVIAIGLLHGLFLLPARRAAGRG